MLLKKKIEYKSLQDCLQDCQVSVPGCDYKDNRVTFTKTSVKWDSSQLYLLNSCTSLLKELVLRKTMNK